MSPATISGGRAPTHGSDVSAGETTSLASVAGRQATLLSGVGMPLYAVGAIVTDGVGRWVMLGVCAMLIFSACLRPRQQTRREAPAPVALCVGTVVLWSALAPTETILLTACLGIGSVYLALMAPRPFAEVGLVAMTGGYVWAQFAFGAHGDQGWQVIGAAITDLGLGILVLNIRIITERKVDERTQALAAANDRLEHLNRIDPLTGLANRRRLAELLDDIWSHAASSGQPVSAIMVDIDFFKQYNDRYGHLKGDACLQKVAAALRESVRADDVVVRYGGEEFTLVLANADLDVAYRIAEHVRTEVAKLGEEHAMSPTGSVSISVGVCSAYPGGQIQKDDLLRLADEGLYAAKRSGRDQVAVAPTVQPEYTAGG